MEQELRIRTAEPQDADKIMAVMKAVERTMESPEWFVADGMDYVIRHLDGTDGFTVVAENHVGQLIPGQVVAFFIIDYPRDREDNLGYDIGLSRQERMRVAHMDTVCVLEDYRGNHLMERLLQTAEEKLSQTGFCHLMATVHPDNRYSLENMISHGYQVAATKGKYGGLLRHILYKRRNDHQEKPVIMVSACLLGVHCRYSGTGVLDEGVRTLMERAILVPVCPEILGGLATPRDPAECLDGRVLTVHGADVTDAYQRGAQESLRLAELYGSSCALLKERSPSCGCGRIYDGTHSRVLTDGDGVTAKLLKEHGICVFGESKINELKDFIEDM